MKNYQHLLASAVVTLLLAGCETTKTVESVDLPPPAEIEVRKSILTSKVSYKTSDGYFEISGTDDNLTSFVVRKQNADIRDLASFSTALYRNELAPKLLKGEKLTRAELQLLDFCVFTQVSAIRAYTLTGLQDMLQDTKLPDPADNPVFKDIQQKAIKNFHEQVRDVCYTMQKDFGNSNSILRKKLLDWGKSFQPINDKILVADLVRIQQSSSQKVDDFQWRQLWLYVPYVNWVTLWWEKEFHETKALRPYKAYSQDQHETALQWKALNTTMSYPLKELKSMYEDMGKYIEVVKDSRSRAGIDDFRLSMDNEMRSAVILNSFVFNDLPFSIFCKHAYIGIQNCKGAFDDDEDAMEDVISKFLVRVNGADMLCQIKSPHTADIYVQLLELIKSELGDTRYKNYLTRSKLYELDAFNPSAGTFDRNKVK